MTAGEEIRFLIFDADDTFFELKEPLAGVYKRHFERVGIQADEVEIAAALRFTWNDLQAQYLNFAESHKTDAERERNFWKKFVSETALYASGSEPSEELFEPLYDYYSKAESRNISPYGKELLEHCKKSGISCALVSNNDQRLHGLVEDFRLSDKFALILTGAELGWKKPSPHFFNEVEKRLDAKADEILYLGNDLELDYLPATKAGWKALWYRPGGKLPEESSTVPQISSFSELMQ